LASLTLIAAARPGLAQCPQLEPSFSITGVTNGTQTATDQALVNVGGCVTLRLLIVAEPGGPTDVTNSANTTFVLDPARGTFTSKNVWCATAADCGHDLTIYGIYRDPCSGTTLVATVQITVAHCPILSPAAGCPQLEPALSITGVSNGTKLSADQANVNVGGCVTLQFLISAQPGGTTNVTSSANTTFVTDPVRGTFTAKNVWCATAADCGKDLTIYGIYHDPCSGTNLVATVQITVAPCPIAPAKPGCPQLEPSFSITGVTNGTQNAVDDANVNVGGCVTLRLLIVSEPGGAVDKTFSPNTQFTTNPTQGFFSSKNVWCALPSDCNKEFPIYAIYSDPCTGTTLVSTVHITVTPCTVPGEHRFRSHAGFQGVPVVEAGGMRVRRGDSQR